MKTIVPTTAIVLRARVVPVFLQLAAGTVLLVMSGIAGGFEPDEESLPATAPSKLVRTVERGFVVVEGVYVSPPYTIEADELGVTINGHPVTANRRGHRAGTSDGNNPTDPVEGRFNGPRGRGAGMYYEWGWRPRPATPAVLNGRFALRLDSSLSNDAVMLVFDEHLSATFDPPLSSRILSALLSDKSAVAKAREFGDRRIYSQLTAEQWARVIASFSPTDELRRRAVQLIEADRRAREAGHEAIQSARWYEFLASKRAQYGVTLTAMVLAVVAMGNLLLYRPQGTGRWSDVNDGAAEGLNMKRIVAILALLGTFDLLLTLAAQKTGGFLELNPLGSQLIDSPISLAAFKLVSLIAACWILLRLQHYRGAQLASWWMCMVCTLLTFRWVTFNSLFMG